MTEIHLGRWQDTIPGTYDPAMSVVITDPPFGIGRLAYEDSVSWADHVREVLTLLPASRHVIRGPSPLICRMDVPPPRRMVVEAQLGARRYSANRPGVMAHIWHGWLVWGGLRMGKQRVTADAFTVSPYDDSEIGWSGGNIHDAKTPFGACYRIVSMLAEPGYTVIDPFAGCGTIGYAAQRLGHPYIGAETDVRWHAQASRLVTVGIQSEMFA